MSIKYNGEVVAGKYKSQVIPSADTVNEGTIRIATQEEVDSGVDNTTAVTPLYLNKKQDNLIAGDGIQLDDVTISAPRKADNKTIVENSDNTLTTIGQLTKAGTFKFDWEGTEAEYTAGMLDGTISPDWYCYITDDEVDVDMGGLQNLEWGNITGDINNQADLKENFSDINLSNLTENGLKVIKDNSGAGLEICDIGIALYIDESKGLRRYLNGQIMAINANTQAFLNRLKQIQAVQPDWFTTEENWQAEATLSVGGYVDKFVIADDESTVRLPNYPDYILTSSTVSGGSLPVSVYGNGMALGFTKTGSDGYGTRMWSSQLTVASNAFGAKLNTTPTGSASYPGDTQVVGVTTNPQKSGLTGKADASSIKSVEQTLRLKYFIQIATGAETEAVITNTLENNVPYTLLQSMYSATKLNNASMLLSAGQENPYSVYPTAYEAVQVEYNSEIADGTTVTLPSGVSYTKVGVSGGISVKLSTDSDITDYDFELNTANQTFRLPLLNGDECLLGNNVIDTDFVSKEIGTYTWTAPYNGLFCLKFTASATTPSSVVGLLVNNVLVDAVGPEVGLVGSVEHFCKKGDIIKVRVLYNTLYELSLQFFSKAQGNGSLYYFVGATTDNSGIVNLGRVEEQLANKADLTLANVNKEATTLMAHSAIPSSKVVHLTLGATNTRYTAPADGWIVISKRGTAAGQWLSFYGVVSHTVTASLNSAEASMVIPVQKGESFGISYNVAGETVRFVFHYANGAGR